MSYQYYLPISKSTAKIQPLYCSPNLNYTRKIQYINSSDHYIVTACMQQSVCQRTTFHLLGSNPLTNNIPIFISYVIYTNRHFVYSSTCTKIIIAPRNICDFKIDVSTIPLFKYMYPFFLKLITVHFCLYVRENMVTIILSIVNTRYTNNWKLEINII